MQSYKDHHRGLSRTPTPENEHSFTSDILPSLRVSAIVQLGSVFGGRANTSSRPHTYLGAGCPTGSAKWPLWLKPPASTEALSSPPHNRARIRTSGSIAHSLELPSHPAGGHYHLESTTIFLFGFLWLGMMHIRFITVKLCIGLL